MPAFAAPAGQAALATLPARLGGGTLEVATRPGAADPGDAAGATSFHVASNAAFLVDAEISPAAPDTLAAYGAVPFGLLVSPDGRASRHPHSGGTAAGLTGAARTLGDLAARRTVFRGDRSTAASRGTIADQSVRFDVLIGDPESPVPAAGPVPDIVFSVYVP